MLYCIAARSIDPRTNTAALIVSADHSVLATGYNSLPRKISEDQAERLERPGKYAFFEHAERNAIYEAARRGQSLLGGEIYTLFIPCAECARAIIQCGLRRVVVHADHPGNAALESDKHAIARVMLEEAGIPIIRWQGQIALPEIRFDGEVFSTQFGKG